MIAVEAEVSAGLIGLVGATLGAIIGGGASLVATGLTLRHQRTEARETRLAELRMASTDATATELIRLDQYLRSITFTDAPGEDRRHWVRGAADHLRAIRLAAARIPDRTVRTRLAVPLDLASEYRAAPYWQEIQWVSEMVKDALEVVFVHQ